MAITYGFYNSMNGDRKYDAVQLSSIFDGVIRDGVFQSIGGYLVTKPGTGMQVIVAPGKAWFDHTWTVNDSIYPLDIREPDLTLKRYDAVVLETDATKSVRVNSIKIVEGTPSTEPQKPRMEKGEFLNQHALAYVLVNPGVSNIQEKDIEIVVGKDECPFVTSILESVSIEALLAKWESEFRVWFDELQSQMEGDVATNLQNQINELDERITPLEILGSRVETNTYNIAMLALLHAKAGEFPPNTKKMIVHVSGSVYNLRDYCGITPDANNLRSTVGKYPTKNTIASSSITGLNYVRYKGKYVWQSREDHSIFESSDLNGQMDKKVLLDDVYTGRDGVSFYILNGKLRIGIISQLGSWSNRNSSVKIYEYDGDQITLKTEHEGIYCSNVNSYNKSIAIDSEKAFYTYNTGDSDREGHGGVLLDDGSHTAANGIGAIISSRVNSPTGLYVGTREYFNDYPSTTSYIRSVTRSGATPVTMPGNDITSACVLYNGKAFFVGSRGIYAENDKNSFSMIAFPDTDISDNRIYGLNAILFIYKNKLYFMARSQEGGKHAYRFDGESFVQDDELYHVFGYTSNPIGTLPSVVLYDERGNQLGLSDNTKLYEHTFSENGVYETIDYDVGSFGSADIYVGGKLSGYSVKVSTDGGTSWKTPKETSVEGTEIRAHFDGLEGSSLSVRVEFDLGSGYIDYIVGGVY